MGITDKRGLMYRPFQPTFEKGLDTYTECQAAVSGAFNGGLQFYGFYMDNLNVDKMFVLPDGCMNLVICCCRSHPSANICGSLFRGRQGIFVRPECEYFVIRFLPGYAEHFFKYPIGEFSEQEIPVQEIVPHAAVLLERVAEKDSFAERVRAFESFYRDYISGTLEIHKLVKYLTEKIIDGRGASGVSDLSQDTGYSSRYILKVFERYVGTSPKLFSRIVRFQHVLSTLETEHYERTLDRIFDLGYFDQNHFIKEFKEFSFTTPKKYIQQAGTIPGNPRLPSH
ncbi:AraC family transcriptional regulator [Paenibacillus sp. HW567]|uniref:AraC family transcriptional regulator n=1 Tax=Paenibacillus sp. HW567 TaxID=1034769 RepID=UPI000369376D|nr:helix-turn-helix domain-containing protein [Paenibacillus sp. HW567]